MEEIIAMKYTMLDDSLNERQNGIIKLSQENNNYLYMLFWDKP